MAKDETSDSENDISKEDQENLAQTKKTCTKCKNDIDKFDLFCGNCLRATFNFKFVFILEVLFFFHMCNWFGH